MEFKNARRHSRDARPGASRPAAPQPRPAPRVAASPEPAPMPAQRTKPSAVSRLRRAVPKNKKRAAILGGTAAACIVAGFVAYAATNQPRPEVTSPSYDTVLPKDKSISALGGWKRVSPPDKEPAFAYADTINGVAVSVSQQPLPKGFSSNTESQVADLASKFNATDKVEAGNTKAYVGTSAKGPQSVIFAKGSVLVLIKSQKKISNDAWAQYIAALE